MNPTIESEAKKFIGSLPLTLSKDMFGGYKVTYSFLVSLLEEFAKSQLEARDREMAELKKESVAFSNIILMQGKKLKEAKVVMIEFVEWVDKKYVRMKNGKDKGKWVRIIDTDFSNLLTTSELFQIFTQQTEGK